MTIITPPRLVTHHLPPIGDVSADVSPDLAHALSLISIGVPVFVATPNSTYDRDAPKKLANGELNPAAKEFHHPPGWQDTPASTQTLKKYRPGDALCAVMGVTIDAFDIDPKNGASVQAEAQRLKELGVTIVGYQITPSGGAHFFTPSTGIRTAATTVNGIDFKAGGRDGKGRGFVYLAPTPRPKYQGTGYVLDNVPDAASLDLFEATINDNTDAAVCYLTAIGIKPKTESLDTISVTSGEPVGELPQKLQELLAAPQPWERTDRNTGEITEGDRSGRFYYLAKEAQRAGLTQGQAVTVLTPWCNSVGKFVGRVPGEVARVWPKVTNDLAKELAAEQWANDLPISESQSEPGNNLEDEPSTWLAHDLTEYLTGVYVPLEPTMLQRADGKSLIYPGKIHSIYGESESGKSFVMQALCATEIMLGRKVIYIDFEDSPAEIVHRLRLFGASIEQIRDGFTYVQPGESLSTLRAQHALRTLLTSTYSLCIIDGYTTAMNMISPSNGSPEAQVTAFMSALPRRIVRHTKAAVITVDHVTKSKDSRGRFAVGSQEKLNQITGAGYSIEVVNMIAPGARGELVMRVTKDRIGQVRANAGKYRSSDRTQEVARIHVDSTDPTWINVEIANPSGQGTSDWRPTYYMQRVSEYLETCPGPVSSADIKSNVTGKGQTIVTALQMLVTDGFVERVEGARGTNLHISISPYFDPQGLTNGE